MEIQILKKRVAVLLWFFIVALLLSGLTAFVAVPQRHLTYR